MTCHPSPAASACVEIGGADGCVAQHEPFWPLSCCASRCVTCLALVDVAKAETSHELTCRQSERMLCMWKAILRKTVFLLKIEFDLSNPFSQEVRFDLQALHPVNANVQLALQVT